MAIIAKSNLEQLEEWKRLYRNHLGLDTDDFRELRDHWRREEDLRGIPILDGDGFGELKRLIIVSHWIYGYTAQKLFIACGKLFECDFPSAWLSHSRHSVFGHDVSVWVRDEVEASEELANKSAHDLDSAGLVTLSEEGRLLYELKFFTETGEHLDRKVITLCVDSLSGFDLVPAMRWRMDCLWRGEYGVQRALPRLRARRAVYMSPGEFRCNLPPPPPRTVRISGDRMYFPVGLFCFGGLGLIDVD